MDVNHLRNLPPAIMPRRTRPAATAPLAQQSNQLLFELPTGIGIDGVVDRLVKHMLAWIIGMHALQCAGNLLGRPTPEQKIADHMPQSAMRVQLGQRPRGDATGFAGGLGGLEGIAIGWTAIASKLTANGAGAAPEAAGNGALAPALLQKRGDRQAVFWLQVRVL